MNQRKVHTKIWRDDWFCGLSITAKTVFFYLFTNQYIGLTGIYELSDRTICFDTGLTQSKLDEVKKELRPKIKFHAGWVYVENAEKYDPVKGKENNLYKAKEKEIESIPEDIVSFFYTSQSPSEAPSSNDEAPSKNEEGSNGHGNGNGNGKKDKSPREGSEDGKALLVSYNDFTSKNLRSSLVFEANLQYWRKIYSLEEITKALEVAVADPYWKEIITPDILLRTKDKHGSDVDRVGQFLAKASKTHIKPKDNLLAIAQGAI